MARQSEIHAIERKDARRKRYGIWYPRPGGRARRVFFDTKKERDLILARDLRIAKEQGLAVFAVSASDVRLLKDLREMLPAGVDPREAVRFYLAHNGEGSRVELADAVAGFLRSMELRRVAEDYERHMAKALGRFVDFVGRNLFVNEVETEMLVSFFSSLPFTPRTLANYQKMLRAFFAWSIKSGYILRSPMEPIASIQVPESEPEFLRVDEAERFFVRCLEINPDMGPYLALSFFAGLRSASINRLRREDIRFEERGILLPGAKHKTGRRFYVEGFPENLWDWLAPWKKRKHLPELGKTTLNKRREKIYLSAGINFPRNAGRHSFCTYHVALHGDAGKTATLLTHRGSVAMLYNHYRGNATKTDALRYFSIHPK